MRTKLTFSPANPEIPPDSLGVRLKRLRSMQIQAQQMLAQSKRMHDDLLVRLSKMVQVENFSVNMAEGVEEANEHYDLYVMWVRDGTTPIDEMEKREVHSFIHTLKGLGYKVMREQESPHDVECWLNAK